MKDADALWDSENRTMSMRESIFVGMQQGDAHARFVVFHEISHYVLGHEGTRTRAVEKVRGYSGAKVKHEESEASRLAVVLMAPEHLIPENATPEKISEMFGMSLTAAIIRKEEVDRVRRRRRGEFRPLPESVKEVLRNARNQGMNIRTQLD